ncbi:DUF4198 domain-containing protein [Actibacterium sp. 188UL27-1]|uniref:DUF4198 domain-containing protein n=1 Tax=Actibacterium sp. 188UL27-1 TaxID=2786961 RepID=UPI0019563FC7|nr:DUF4198 domain-containing protein [Actibacterium sp. 188UL27-1]MBM7066348.1 DUF4198 domain-containing protein [Actibacterium sp. 188UL27-1]
MTKILATALAFWASATAATAHFQLIYTEDTGLTQTGSVPLKLLFWHPFENGAVMDMARPQQLFAVHRGERMDLMGSLEETVFTGAENAGRAFNASLPVKRSGDYVLVVVPEPYLEESEDTYIQQFTKTYLNRRGLPTDWTNPMGLPAEILPLVKPHNVIAGSTFTGRVMRDGAPVAGAEIEVEYMAAEPDMAANAAGPATATPPPGGAVVILSDEQGYFSFGVPKAGHWGFAALGVGPETQFNGKDLSQDAVLWIRAHDLIEGGE